MKNKLLNNNLVRLLMVLVVLTVCACLGIGIAIYEDRSNPTNFVAKYLGKFLTQNYEEMLEFSDVEGAFIPKGKFSELMKEFRAQKSIGEYEIKKPAVASDGRYFVRVEYENMDTTQKEYWDIYLAKKNLVTKAFTGWKIDISQYLVSDFTVKAPSGMKLTIDGVEIDESNATIQYSEDMHTIVKENGETVKIEPIDADKNVEDDYTIYTFPSIIKGTHTLKAEDQYTEIVDEIKLENNSITKALKLKKRVVNKDYDERLKEFADEFIQIYYDNVKDRKDTSKTLKAYLADDKELRKKVKNIAQKDIEAIYWPDVNNIENYSLKDREFSEIKTKVNYKDKDKFNVECKYSFKYVSGTKTEIYDSYVNSISGKCNVKLTMTVSVVKDKLKITSVKMERENIKN
ncbi:MAG: hypothetical protein IKN54_02145 [Lachnospiraceae bacterium]|nr:hypothetical protein [Lachnospiraceae bacterium]